MKHAVQLLLLVQIVVSWTCLNKRRVGGGSGPSPPVYGITFDFISRAITDIYAL